MYSDVSSKKFGITFLWVLKNLGYFIFTSHKKKSFRYYICVTLLLTLYVRYETLVQLIELKVNNIWYQNRISDVCLSSLAT